MAQFASDAFGGTEGTELSTYSASWTKAPTLTGDMEIASGRIRPSSTTSPGYYHSGTPASADYTVSADVYKTSAATSNSMAVTGRQSTSADTLYRASSYRASTTQTTLQLFKFVSGTATQLGSNVNVTHNDGETRQIKLEMIGTAIKLYHDGSGSASISATDSSITDAGKAGVRAYSSTTPSDTNGVHLDNFSADDVSSGITQPLGLNTGAAEVPQAFGKAKQKIIGQIAGSAETLFSITPALAAPVTPQPLGLITGAAETLFPITSAKQKAIGLAVGGAEQVNPFTAKKTKAVGLLSDAPGELPGVTLTNTRALGLINDEAGQLFSITPRKRKAIGFITTADQLFDVTPAKRKAVGLVTGAEELLPLTAVGGATLALTQEDINAVAAAVWAHSTAVEAHAKLDAILARLQC